VTVKTYGGILWQPREIVTCLFSRKDVGVTDKFRLDIFYKWEGAVLSNETKFYEVKHYLDFRRLSRRKVSQWDSHIETATRG
jgi:hypothetical protein